MKIGWLALVAAWAVLTAVPALALVEVEYQPPNPPEPGQFCGLPGFNPPEDLAVFAIAGDGGKALDRCLAAKFSPRFVMKVTVNSPQRPAALLLLSSSSTVWHISWTPGTRIAAVSLAGPGAQHAAGLPEDVPVMIQADNEPCRLDLHLLRPDIDRPRNLVLINKASEQIFGRPLSALYLSQYQQEMISAGEPLAASAAILTAEELNIEKYVLPGLPRVGRAGLQDALARGWIRPPSAGEMARSPWRPGGDIAKQPQAFENSGGRAASKFKSNNLCLAPKQPSNPWGGGVPQAGRRAWSARPWQAIAADHTFVITDERFIVPENLLGREATAFLLAPGLPLPKIAAEPMSGALWFYRMDQDRIVSRLPVAETSSPAWDEAPEPDLAWPGPAPPAIPVLETCAFPDLELPLETAVYAVGGLHGARLGRMLDSESGLEASSTRVVVNSPQRPVALILGADQPNIWRLGWTGGSRIAAVYITGHRSQQVSGLPPETPVFREAERGPCGAEVPRRHDPGKMKELSGRLFGRDLTGIYSSFKGRQEVVLGLPLRPGTRLYTERLFRAADFIPPDSPETGQAGLDRALARDWIRPATREDWHQWREARGGGGGFGQPGEELEHSYVILDQRFIPPAKLNHHHYYYLPAGMPVPRGFRAAYTLRWLEDGGCCLSRAQGQMECEDE